jgi:nucleotide-binding universal stress UspA family protein
MEKAAADRLRKIAASLPQEISVRTLVRRGDPAEEILAAARELLVDVICLGARGRGRVAGALLGSVSSAVLRGSAVPVVVWRPPPG